MKFGKKKPVREAEVTDRSALVLTKDETRWGRMKKWLKPCAIIIIILCILLWLFVTLIVPTISGDDVIALETRKVTSYDFAQLDGVTLPAGVPDYMVPVARRGELTLCVCAEGGESEYGNRGEFCVVRGDGEQIWYSNPRDKESEEETAAGKFRWEMFSQVLISTYDDNTTTTESYNSYWHASSERADNESGFSIKSIDDGFVCYYTFATPKVTIPLYVRLNDKGVEVFTCENEFKEKSKTVSVMKVTLLPYFNSGSTQDTGYMLVPDGSGAIINFNNGKNEGIISNISKYSADVYGTDVALRNDYAKSGTYKVAIPAFGIKNNETSFVALVTQGDSAASVVAYTSGSKNLQNTVYPVFERYTSGTVTIGERGDYTAREVEKQYTAGAQFSVAEVKYMLLETGSGEYSDMAAAVREYMLENADLGTLGATDDKLTMFLNFTGGQYKKESVAGILVNKLKVFTSVDNMDEIVSDFNGAGIDNIVASYTGWNTDDIKNSKFVTGVKIPSGLGSVKKLKALYEKLDGNLYLGYNPINMPGNGHGLSKSADSAKDLGGSPVKLYVYSLATGYAGAYNRGATAISAKNFEELMQRYITNVDKTGTDFGTYVSIEVPHYSSFSRRGFISKEAYSVYIEDMLTVASEGNSVLLNFPLYYQLKYAKYALEVPTESSSYDITDYSVPFYQMVVSGSITYSGDALNFEGDIHDATMRALETGSALYYSFIYKNPYELKDTWYEFLYGASYENGFEGAVEAYNEVSSVYEKLGSMVLRAHRVLASNVSESTFENGARLVLNYSSADFVTEEGYTVAGDSYIIISKEGVLQ